MSILTEEEKARIREEIYYREEIKALFRSHSSKETPPAIRFLNSAFVVTLLGGIIVAALGHFWQDASLNRQKELSRLESASQQRYDLLHNFVQDFESTTMILGTLHKQRIALAELTSKRNADPASVPQATFDSANKSYQDTWLLYKDARKINSYEVQIKARYKDAAVMSALDALDNAVNATQNAKNEEGLEATMAMVDKTFALLASAMVSEVARNEL